MNGRLQLVAASLTALVLVASGATIAYASATVESDDVSTLTSTEIEVCPGNSLSRLDPNGRILAEADLEVALLLLEGYCERLLQEQKSAAGPDATILADPPLSPGDYVSATISQVNLSCGCDGNIQRTMEFKGAAHGLPTTASQILALIHRRVPGTWVTPGSIYIAKSVTYGYTPAYISSANKGDAWQAIAGVYTGDGEVKIEEVQANRVTS